jgi:8-oxo-dGTP pyrophosphatase MutT (NUDIX family)
VEPPDEHEALDEAALARNAARELVEEIGVDLPPDELSLWAVTRGKHRSVGLVYLAPPQPATVLRERFEAATAAEQALARDPELDRIALVRSPADLANLDRPHVDYLEPVLTRYLTESLPRDA